MVEETHFTGMPSVDVSQGKYITPPKRLVMLLHCDKNGDFSVPIGLLFELLAKSQIAWRFLKFVSLEQVLSLFFSFFFSVALVYVFSVLIIYVRFPMSSQRGERDADSKTQEIRYSKRNFLLNEILDWDRH